MKASGASIEVTGYIKKEEQLTALSGNILSHTCVLENSHPFPGYHGYNLPDMEKPRSLFFPIINSYTFEDIARISKRIDMRIGHDFNAAVGTLFIQPYTYQSLRIKYLASFSLIPGLQQMFADEGIKFYKYKDIEAMSIIVVQKNFLVEEAEPGIYRDLENRSKFYFEIPEPLTWETFKQFTRHIKNNLVDNNFDAALGVFYRLKGIVDMVRIYDQNPTVQKMQILKCRYEGEILKFHK